MHANQLQQILCHSSSPTMLVSCLDGCAHQCTNFLPFWLTPILMEICTDRALENREFKITMNILLCALWKVERLERKYPTRRVQIFQKLKSVGIGTNIFNCFIELEGILYPVGFYGFGIGGCFIHGSSQIQGTRLKHNVAFSMKMFVETVVGIAVAILFGAELGVGAVFSHPMEWVLRIVVWKGLFRNLVATCWMVKPCRRWEMKQ